MRMSQEKQVLQYMRDFGSITTYDAFTDLGITRLSARINELRKTGYEIEGTPETRRNRYGRKVTFNRYKEVGYHG